MKLTGTLKNEKGENVPTSIDVTMPTTTTPPPPPPVVTEPPPTTELPPIVTQPTGSPPLVYTDARYSANATASSSTLQRGATIANKSITDTGQVASIVMFGGGCTVKNCRIKSREGLRVSGGGDFNISDTYVEVNGTGADHADGLQAYSPGDKGKIIVRNSTFKCGLDAATAGFFIADNWTGTIDLENVVFLGGPFGLRVHPDTGGNNILRLKNVFFVPPFGYQPYLFTNVAGKRNLFDAASGGLWENVCMATISNGKLVPGASIARPG